MNADKNQVSTVTKMITTALNAQNKSKLTNRTKHTIRSKWTKTHVALISQVRVHRRWWARNGANSSILTSQCSSQALCTSICSTTTVISSKSTLIWTTSTSWKMSMISPRHWSTRPTTWLSKIKERKSSPNTRNSLGTVWWRRSVPWICNRVLISSTGRNCST